MGTSIDESTRPTHDRKTSVTVPTALIAGDAIGARPVWREDTARYTEQILLGEGGMGKVHLCRDELIGRDVAMKVILPDLEADAGIRARFLREASVQGQLEHPNIVPVHEIGATPEGASFFTMKRVRGSTLDEIIRRTAAGDASLADRFTMHRLLTAFVSVCLAVDFAHSRGVIHRDLKPGNVMLGDFGEVYVLDWGIAKLARDSEPERAADAVRDQLDMLERGSPVPKTAEGAILGTVAYMAPEQLRGKPASVQSDVFALGAILFELLTGLVLREGVSFAGAARGRHDARCSSRAPDRGIAPELEAICVRATAVDPGQRFPSARALSEDVERFLEGDLDLVRRREQAASHVKTAQDALARATADTDEQAATRAMRELGAALALDPENVDARALVVETLTTVPRKLPREVVEALEQAERNTVVAGARRLPIILLCWLGFTPLLYWAGVRQLGAVFVGLFLLSLGTVIGAVVARRAASVVLEYAALVAVALGMVAAGRAFGPFVLAPTLLATFAAALQLHPRARVRMVALAACVAALVLSVALEYSGALPRMVGVVPPALVIHISDAVREGPTTIVIVLANVTATISTALIIANVRARLTRAEERLLIHSWQVRGMMPALVTGGRTSAGRIRAGIPSPPGGP